MRIDLHCHTSERSSCSVSSEQEQIQKAISFGLDGIVITDHNKAVPPIRLQALNKKYSPFKIFAGIEITVKDTREDILVIGIQDDLLEQKKWTYEALYHFVKKANGFLILAHPYRYDPDVKSDTAAFPPDAIEVHSTNIGRSDEELITSLAHTCGAQLICNSDSHNKDHIGIFHNEFSERIETDEGLVTQLKAGAYKMCRDEKRIEEFNQAIIEREKRIRELIADGKTAADYEWMTGNWRGHFDRVAMGKSYEI